MNRKFFLFLASILFLVFLPNASHSQPATMWFNNFNGEQGGECFYDIYAAHDSSYIAVGSTGANWQNFGDWFMVKVDKDGRTIWAQTYNNNIAGAVAKSVIEADNGDFLAAGQSGRNRNVEVMRVNADGQQIWRNQYLEGEGKAIIELKGNDFLVCGVSGRGGFLLLVNGEGQQLWSRTYAIGDPNQGAYGFFNSMRETDNQVVVAGEGRRTAQDSWHNWLIKANIGEEGALIWERHNEIGELATCNTIISCEGGFVVSGMALRNTIYSAYIAKINHEGELQWDHILDCGTYLEIGWCLAKTAGGSYAIAGRAENFRSPYKMPMMIRTTSEGTEQGRSYHDFGDRGGFQPGYTQFYSCIVGLDNSLIAAGNVNTNATGYDGLIMKWAPDQDGPFLVSWTPEDSLLTVLQGDSVEFAVHAEHQWGVGLDYYWWMDEGDTITRDTTVTITFNDLGEHVVYCSVSDGRTTVTKSWYVNVIDFYLADFIPASTEISTARGNSIQFILGIIGVEDFQVDYSWIQTGRGDDRLIEGDNVVTVDFPLSGRYFLEAEVFNENNQYEVTWDIQVVSSIWSWEPESLEWTVSVDSTIEFAVRPFNMESDSLEYIWLLDGEIIARSEETEVTFAESGQRRLQGIINDGAETDTVFWSIEVVLPNGVSTNSNSGLPDRVTLNPPTPNPFNSTTRLSYEIPQAGKVTFGVFDISGREVAQLFNGWNDAGRHEFAFNAADLTAGVYFARLEMGRVILIKKFMLIK